MNIQTWYGHSIEVPTFKSWRFTGFVVSCLGIVRTVLRENLGERKIQIVFQKGGTAAAGQRENVIRINEDYLNGKLTQCGGREVQLNSEQALGLLMGLTVHETAHFAYSDPLLDVAAEFIKANTKAPYVQEIAVALANIVEDIFIESEVDRDAPGLTWMLDQMNNLYFDETDLEERMSAAASIVEAPANSAELQAAGNLLVLAKVFDRIEGQSKWMTDLFYLARSAVLAQKRTQRYELSLAIYDELMKNMPESECGEGGEASKTGEGMAEDTKGFTAGHAKGDEGERREALSVEAREINEDLAALMDALISLSPKEDETDLRLGDIYVEKMLTPGPAVKMDRRYEQLAVIARQNAVVNQPYGLDRNRGHHIRKLSRIATDCKIFAEPAPTRRPKPMKVLILLDCSGSMRADVQFTGKTRLQLAKEATMGACYGLLEGRCEVAIYGHTSELYTDADVVLYRVKDFNESFEGVATRLGSIGDSYENRVVQNRDGCAIRYIYPKLRDPRKHKLLIVVSDGSPVATGYHGQRAKVHTKGAVEEARRAGIDVLSISISQEAKESNNFIYGKEWNVHNEDPNVLAEIVQRLVAR